MPFPDATPLPRDRPMDTTRKSGVSKIFQQSVPSFIIDEYPLFVEFLEAYYEWLDQNGNPVEFLQNGNRYFDIDTTTREFLDHFKTTFLEGFPKKMAINEAKPYDERTLIKNIREFYKMKGSEKSIHLLYRIIADSETSIEYPRDLIFSLSSANYKDYQKIHVLKNYAAVSNGFDPSAVHGLQINQYEGLTQLIASATIDSVYEISRNGKQYLVFLVNNPTGTFIQSDFSPVIVSQGATAHEFFTIPSVSELKVENGGSGYSVGNLFTVGSTASENISGYVSQTDYNGKIIGVKILSNPVDYRGSTAVHIESPLGTGGQFSVVKSVLTDIIEEYKNNRNLLSKESKIQDSFEYQQFSYVVKSKRSLEDYIDAIKKVIHPSGFVMFNSLYNNIGTIRPSEYGTRILAYERTSIGSYAMYNGRSSTGSGMIGGWNPFRGPGDPNPTKRWGQVYYRWNDAFEVNPSEGFDSLPSPGFGNHYQFGDFAPNINVLPNPDQTQVDGITHWIAMPHPATRGMPSVPPGTQFQQMKLKEVLRMPVPIIAGGGI
jgi:hypothetical protein